MDNDKIQLFEDKKIRTAWDEEKEEWYFSIVDVVGVLTDQPTPRNASTYWAVLKKRLKALRRKGFGVFPRLKFFRFIEMHPRYDIATG